MLLLLLISSYFRIHKSDIKTNKGRCGTAKHFNGKCNCKSFQIIEQAYSNATYIEELLWHREKYWQSQKFTMIHDMYSLADLYSSKRKGYRK